MELKIFVLLRKLLRRRKLQLEEKEKKVYSTEELSKGFACLFEIIKSEVRTKQMMMRMMMFRSESDSDSDSDSDHIFFSGQIRKSGKGAA